MFQFQDVLRLKVSPQKFLEVFKEKPEAAVCLRGECEVSPQKFLEVFKEEHLRQCPSGSVTPVQVSDTEFLFEVKSGGCPHFGDQDEIDRFLFTESDAFHLIYTVKAREMTPVQRDVGIAAVNKYKLAAETKTQIDSSPK
jgi:hypothetical protein